MALLRTVLPSPAVLRTILSTCLFFLVGCSAIKGNIDYRTKSACDTGGTIPIRIKDGFTMVLEEAKLNDRYGNNFERAILVSSGILDEVDNAAATGVPIGADVDVLSKDTEAEIDNYFTKERVNSLREAAKAADDSGVQISAAGDIADRVKAIVKAKLEDELKAKYNLSITTSISSFTRFAQLTTTEQLEFDQENPDSTLTDISPQLPLFNGSGVNRIDVSMTLTRDSLIARSLNRGLDKLKDSTLAADALKSALASVSYGIASELGEQIGRRIDGYIYDQAKKRYAPRAELFSNTWKFQLTDEQTAEHLSLMDLREGKNSLIVYATPEGDEGFGTSKVADDSKLFSATLTTKRTSP